jgi:hypothetical protein
MRDVERAIAVAMATYEAKPKSKARIWLRKSEARMWLTVVSGKIMYYGNIIDISILCLALSSFQNSLSDCGAPL